MTDRSGHPSAASAHVERAGSAAAASVAQPAAPAVGERLHDWVVEHDDSKVFVVLYIGLAVVLSVWISLFWLVAVVAVHFAFELIRQQRQHAALRATVLEAAWEVKLDVALVLFALVLALYMEVVLGVVGLQAAARIGAASRVATRVAGWERALRGILLSLDDVVQVARAATMRRKRAADAPAAAATEVRTPVRPAAPRWGSWSGTYPVGAWIALGLGAVCLLLIFGAPWLTSHSAAPAASTLIAELHPLP